MATNAAARKQSKAMKIVLAKITTLSKLMHFYMVSMEQFGNGVAGNLNPQASALASSANKAASKVGKRAGLAGSMFESRPKPNYGVGSHVHNNSNQIKRLGYGYGYDNEMIKMSCTLGEKKMVILKINEDESRASIFC